MSQFADEVWDDLQALRALTPVTHNITNFVVMNNTANALLAVGAAPIMAHAHEEINDIVAIAHALVVNIGTLSEPWIKVMFEAMAAARARGIPVVLDPVGAGASHLRTDTALRMLDEVTPTIVRGNGSEIRALSVAGAATRGVDSALDGGEALDAAQALVKRHKLVVSISGATDYIVDAAGVTRVMNGHAIMPRVTGLGCTASALTGAFAAVAATPARGASSAMAVMGIAGEMAADKSAGPGTFQAAFLDALYLMDGKAIKARLRMSRT